MNEKVNYDDLIYRYKGNTANVKYDQFDNALSLLDKIRDGKISLTDGKNGQAEFKLDLNKKKKETKNINQKSKKIHSIVLKCFTKQETVIKFYDDYSSMVSEAKLKQLKEQDLKY